MSKTDAPPVEALTIDFARALEGNEVRVIKPQRPRVVGRGVLLPFRDVVGNQQFALHRNRDVVQLGHADVEVRVDVACGDHHSAVRFAAVPRGVAGEGQVGGSRLGSERQRTVGKE